jgi:hypothetical protein
MKKYFESLDVSIGITVPFGAPSLPENTRNMNRIILKWTYGVRRQFFFDKPNSFSDIWETYDLPQLNNKNLTLQNGRRVCLFCSHCPRMFERKLPMSMDKKRRSNYVAPTFSWSYAFVTMWKTTGIDKEWTRHINSKLRSRQQLRMLQRISYSESGSRRTVGGMYAEQHMIFYVRVIKDVQIV